MSIVPRTLSVAFVEKYRDESIPMDFMPIDLFNYEIRTWLSPSNAHNPLFSISFYFLLVSRSWFQIRQIMVYIKIEFWDTWSIISADWDRYCLYDNIHIKNHWLISILIVVVSFQPAQDHAMCPSNIKQTRDTWPLSKLPCRSLRSIQTLSGRDKSVMRNSYR